MVDRQLGPVPALEKIAGKKLILAVADDMTGVPVPGSVLSHNGMPGLVRADQQSRAEQVDLQFDHTIASGKSLPAGSAWMWSGTLTPPSEGTYTLALQILGTSFASLSIDGKLATRTAPIALNSSHQRKDVHPIQDGMIQTTDGLDNLRYAVPLTAGPHDIVVRLDATDRGIPVQARLAWVTPDQQRADYDAAIAAAKKAKTAVGFCMGTRTTESRRACQWAG
jgi:beta-glucosidase